MLLALLPVLLLAVAAVAFDDEPDEPMIAEDEEDLLSVEEPPDLLATLAGIDDAKEFFALLTEAGLDKVLTGEGPHTVFVPTDSAIGTIDLKAVRKDAKKLRALLARHIVVNRYITFDFDEDRKVVTLDGEKVAISISDENITVGNAIVLEEEIWCRNGVVHVLDAVILPAGEH